MVTQLVNIEINIAKSNMISQQYYIVSDRSTSLILTYTILPPFPKNIHFRFGADFDANW